VARQTRPTDRGGFLDIALDFIFYASDPAGLRHRRPGAQCPGGRHRAAGGFHGHDGQLPGLCRHGAPSGRWHSPDYPTKSFYFLGGLTEATETLACFAAMCLWPQHFALLAYGFAALCALTTLTRCGGAGGRSAEPGCAYFSTRAAFFQPMNCGATRATTGPLKSQVMHLPM
jgi:hypothetical protein